MKDYNLNDDELKDNDDNYTNIKKNNINIYKKKESDNILLTKNSNLKSKSFNELLDDMKKILS